jgi:hypothetical protein
VLEVSLRFGGIYCLQLQGIRVDRRIGERSSKSNNFPYVQVAYIFTLKMETVYSSET